MTLVNEFQVQVPAGKVGLVLETTFAGDPVVREVKASSPMAGQVQVGDRLLSVDGENVSMEHATTVSRMIASKAGAPVRRFTFGRPREK
jgi:C-terminal processing protease CtpA/Prc